MKKNQRLSQWLDSWSPDPETELPREYCAYISLFNAAAYYEAHDILEHLWLGCTGGNRSFFQALIQLAGAFVHFQKHLMYPHHPTHGRRLAPGSRLLDLACSRFQAFGERHLNLNLSDLQGKCSQWRQEASLARNPLLIGGPPRLEGCDFAFVAVPPGTLAALMPVESIVRMGDAEGFLP